MSISTDKSFAADCVLMLKMNGADASTNFPDKSYGGVGSPHTVTANGDAQIDTAQSKFGGASALFDGTGDYLAVPDSDDWHFGSGDFTIDFWVRFNSIASNANILAQFSGASDNAWLIQWVTSNNLRFLYTTDGATNLIATLAWTPSTATWYHVVVVRSGADLKAFVDGAQIGSTYNISTDTIYNSTKALAIGSQSAGEGVAFNGWMDELRIVKGTAVWTANFTPPTRDYIDARSNAMFLNF